MQNNIIRFAGDVEFKEFKVVSLNGQSANIINQVVSIEIYEDVFSSFISMSAVIKESVDLINLFPFCGEEYVDLNVVTPGMTIPIKGRFYIYKITDRIYTGEKEVAYTLKCLSVEYLSDTNIKLNKSYQGNISQIAFRLIGKDGLNTSKNINLDNTKNSIKFTTNYWSPVKCLSYISSKAVSENNSPSFLFFENRSGFNFKSINLMLKDKVYQSFVKDNYSRDVGATSLSSYRNIEEDYKRILNISIPVLSDYMKNIQTGQLKSKLISYDILTKKYKVKDYSVKKDNFPFNLLNDNPLYSKYSIANSSSSIILSNKHYGLYDSYADTSNSKTIQKRLSFFENLKKFKVHVTVAGRTDYTVGQIVDLTIPKVAQITSEDSNYKDLMMSGKYLVTAISHTINRENHSCVLELVKNSTIINLSTI